MFGDKKQDCPFWRGPCIENKCRLYIQIMGTNPNTGEHVTKCGCSFEFIPMLLIENSQQTRQVGAGIDRFNNDMVRLNDVAAVQQRVLSRGQEDGDLTKLIGSAQRDPT